jgi:glycosyltransferase involved in cell wall biosynthesis
VKQILHIIPYHNLYPPKNGGQLRCFHLMDQLARVHHVDVLCYQTKEAILKAGYSNKNVRFFNPESFGRKDLWRYLPRRIQNPLRYRFLRRSFRGPANAVFLDFAHIVKNLSKDVTYDVVIFEHLSPMQLSRIVNRYMPQAKTILDAHNIDSKLNGSKTTRLIEENLFKYVDQFWGCSKNDVAELQEMNNCRISAVVVPNGVKTIDKNYVIDKSGCKKKLLFCGSLNYQPNIQGLIWFFDKVWPIVTANIKDIELSIIGRGDTKQLEHLKSDKRIDLIGEVDDVEPYYRESYISIVPLLSGSGTRLKILEAMSFGNPIVTTHKGIEGIEAKNLKEAIIVEKPEDFAKGIYEIIQNPEIGEKLRNNASKLVDSIYDWDVIGNNINQVLCDEI